MNPGLLGEMQVCYLCAMQPPSKFTFTLLVDISSMMKGLVKAPTAFRVHSITIDKKNAIELTESNEWTIIVFNDTFIH